MNESLVEKTLWGKYVDYREPEGEDGTPGEWDLSGAMRAVLVEIESRLSALESQPIKSKVAESTATVDGGWKPFQQKLVRGFWVYWSDGDITLEGYVKAVKDYSGETISPTHIRPYIPGQPKPAAPEVK
jgi:hypothetical protein